MNNTPIEHIVILGGGSAGWITAGLIAADHPLGMADGVQVTLIESPDVATIGVGEGTWPSMRETLQRIGLSEADFLVHCQASFKQGSKFVGWTSGSPSDHYYHPFMLPEGYQDISVGDAWQVLQTNKTFAEVVSAQPELCEQGRAPKRINTPEYAGVMNYGYHLNVGLFGELLKKHCTEKLGVRYIRDHVIGIDGARDGDIEALSTKEHGRVAGDLFVDCSGMKALLLAGHYGIPFVDKSGVLFNDRAVAVQASYPEASAPIASATISTAQDEGWVWDIGLPSRRGVGYVYSSAYTDDQHAEQVLRQYLAQSLTGEALDRLEPRTLGFAPGHRKKFWHRNCVAVGMSSGFLEPLEASALAMVELAAKMISDELPLTKSTMSTVARRFNQRFHYRWDRVIDFLKLHYILSQRQAPYWLDNRAPASTPDSLSELMAIWQNRPPNRNDFFQQDEVFPAASYLYILYGMGFRSAIANTARSQREFAQARQLFEKSSRLTQGYLNGLPANRELIEAIGAHSRA